MGFDKMISNHCDDCRQWKPLRDCKDMKTGESLRLCHGCAQRPGVILTQKEAV